MAALGTVEVALPQDGAPKMQQIDFVLAAGDAVLARNAVSLAVHPARAVPNQSEGLWSADPHIRDYLAALGYRLAESLDRADVVVATGHDAAIAAYVRNGGRLVLLPEAETSLNPFFPHWQNVRVVARQGTLWRGDWASTFAWLRRGRAFGHMPGGPMLDATFDRVLPAHVVTGCNLLDFQGRVYAGLVIGWIHKAVALIVERPYGKGHFVCSTLRLFRDAPGTDPTATMMLDALIAVAAGPIRHTEGLRQGAAAQA